MRKWFIRNSLSLQQLAVGVLAVLLSGLSIGCLKVWYYRGWTWRGYLTDLQTLLGLVAFMLGSAFWLFQVYRAKNVAEALPTFARRLLTPDAIRKTASILMVLDAAMLLTLQMGGDKLLDDEFLTYLRSSNWKYANAHLDRIKSEPLQDGLYETCLIYVSVHSLSDRDQLRGSLSLREDRQRVRQLLAAGTDYAALNSLTLAEISKAIYFIEDAGDPGNALAEGISQLSNRKMGETDSVTIGALDAKIGELELAARNYSKALQHFDTALNGQPDKTLAARINANRGNAYAALGDTTTAIALYHEADKYYPEGRRTIYYSNFGYMLMLANKFDEAQKKIRQALQINPEDWYSYLNLGLVQEATGNFADACENFGYVASKSKLLDPKREGQVLGGRCSEIAKGLTPDCIALYLKADSRNHSQEAIARILSSPTELSALYSRMASVLRETNTHGTERYIRWFEDRAAGKS